MQPSEHDRDMTDDPGAVPPAGPGAALSAPGSRRAGQWPWLVILGATLALVAVRGGQEIAARNEPYFNNDEPRHIMTAVFFSDALRVRPIDDPRGFAFAYYGHYPAIAPLHFPPAMHVLIGTIFWGVGPSVEAARIVILVMFLLLLAATWGVARTSLGAAAAAMAAVFLAGAPMVEQFRATFMLEVPCMLWMTLSVLCMRLYVTSSKARYIWLCAAAGVMAVLTKQHGITLALPLAVGAIMGFRREHWRSVHTYAGPAVGMAAGAAYYVAAIGVLRGSWVDLSSLAQGSFLTCLADLAWGLGPASLAFAAAGLAIGLVRRRLGWIEAVALAWTLGVLALHALVVRTPDSRYLIHCAPAVAILAGAGFERLGLTRWAVLRWPATAAVVALCWYAAVQIPQPELTGYRAAALEANRLSGHGAVMFSGKWDGPFILYRRLDDPELKTVTYRAGKLLGGGNIMTWRQYTPFVNSPEEVRERFAETKVDFVVSEDAPEIDSREHLWFWEWLHSPDFKQIDTIPASCPGGEHRNLLLFEYLGPHADGQLMTIHMMTLRENAIVFDPNRPLIDWNSPEPR